MTTSGLNGAFDMHTHSSPSLYERLMDDLDLARAARDAGMRGVVIKAHECPTVGRAVLVQKAISGIQVFGGVVLNYSVGGLNPQAVEAALRMGGRAVWFPTLHAQNHLEYHRQHADPMQNLGKLPVPVEGISILDDAEKLLPVVAEILHLIREYGVVLGTGHLSRQEILALVEAAVAMGVSKILITHADFPLNGLTLEDQQWLASQGAFLEKCYLCTFPGFGGIPVAEMAQSIRLIGSDRCVLVTDLGMRGKPRPAEGLAAFVKELLQCGIGQEDIQKMLCHNPARLLGLE